MSSPCYPCPQWITPPEFQTQFPEFQNISAAVIQNWIIQAIPFFDVLRWGDLLRLGLMYWVAHQIQDAMANAAQPLTDDTSMQRAGSVSYQRDSQLMNAQSDNPYLTTKYGTQYWKYVRMVGRGAIAL